ncbi:MAG: sodium/solute symporter [Verrucomicrobia bacterium]|nr:sodium/solute symporter [Kiritimatiellia bacterium]MCO6401296.1 sodium/solute symporter [Verrucomicrobiota bacterium]
MAEHASFSVLNYTILAVYLIAMIAIGVLFAGKQKTTEDFFLAGRKMPWLAVAMSMYASLTSAITFIALPASAYAENIAFLVVSLVSPLLAPVLIFLFYPFYMRLRVTTSYEYIHLRFGRPARFAVSVLFILARVGWLGTVIYAPALAMSVVSGIPLSVCILAIGLLATIYTTLGGLAAVIWTDVVQFIIMIGGAIWLVVTFFQNVPDGAVGIMKLAAETGRLHVFDWSFNLHTMGAAIVAISYFFQMMQDYGTDQTTVQRMIAVPSMRGVTKALIFNAVVDFTIIGLLLFIGLGLFAYHESFPGRLPAGLPRDQILPYYIIHALPNGVSGLLITALFAAAMSSMDSGINCISTVIVHDFVKPLRQAPGDDARDVRLARILTFALGALATAAAFYVSSFGHLLKAYTSIISLFNAPILAIFLLGMLTQRARFAPWIFASAFAVATNLWVQYRTDIHWIYYFPLSLGVALIAGYLFSIMTPGPRAQSDLTVWRHR